LPLIIQGPSSLAYRPLLTDKAEVVYLKLECSPCFQREYSLGNMNCLNQIAVDAIYSPVVAV